MSDLSAHPRVSSPDWQPIETAPKDGTVFLAYTVDEGIDFFHWQDLGGDSSAPVGWRSGFITVYREDDEEGPTHWMPLPAPPVSP